MLWSGLNRSPEKLPQTVVVVDDAPVVPVGGKIRDQVRKVRKEKGKQKREKVEAKVVYVHRKTVFVPAAGGGVRWRNPSSLGALGWDSWGKRERGSWSLSRRKRRIESWSKSHEFKRAIKSDVLVLRSSGDEIEQPGEGIRVVGRGEMKRSPWALIRKKRCLI